MRISDWSSDVCSSDLILERHRAAIDDERPGALRIGDLGWRIDQAEHRLHVDQPLADHAIHHLEPVERAKELREQGVHQHDVANLELAARPAPIRIRTEEHTTELPYLIRSSYALHCL